MTQMALTYLVTVGLTALLLSGCAADPGAPAAVTNTNTYADGPVWQGNVCMKRTKAGKQVRVAPSNCPPKPTE